MHYYHVLNKNNLFKEFQEKVRKKVYQIADKGLKLLLEERKRLIQQVQEGTMILKKEESLMNKYKLEYVSYDIYNYTKLNEYFKQKAQSGWLVTKAMGKWILFKKIKPQTLYFNVDLISKSSFYRYDTLPEIQEYIAPLKRLHGIILLILVVFISSTSTTPNIPPLQTDDYITTQTI